MQLGSIRTSNGSTAVRVDGDEVVHLPTTLHNLLAGGAWDLARADGAGEGPFERTPRDAANWAPLIPTPSKIFCVGLNYHEHVREMGREVPSHPTYFGKFADALIGANDDIALPAPDVSTHIDCEAELCIVVGRTARHVAPENALDHVAGYTVLNDVSVRDWQTRTTQFLAGKTFEHTCPVGPVLTTTDELGDGKGLSISSTIDGVTMQDNSTSELIFGVEALIADLSTIATLHPGDLIATGTPSGVGAARTPPVWLTPGAELVTSIEGIGELRNRCVLPA